MSEAAWIDIDTTLNTPTLDDKSKTSTVTITPTPLGNKQKTKENTLNVFSETIEIAEKSFEMGLSYMLGTRVEEIPSTQPVPLKNKSKQQTIWKKVQALAKDKTVSLQKVIDAYGVINSVTKKKDEYEIFARIYDINNHEMIDEITFSADEFTKSDRRKLVENAIFYWHVGKEKSILGQERRVSEFRLRRVYNPESSKR